jgi:hypothetical protein
MALSGHPRPSAGCLLSGAKQTSVFRDGCIFRTQLLAAKVSNLRFRGKVRKFPRHFKGHFSIGNVQVRILPGQPTSHGAGETTPETSRKARNWRPFAIWWAVSKAPEFTKSEANLRKVSGRHREYSRFRETGAGDWVRPPLRGAGCSQIRRYPIHDGPYWGPASLSAVRVVLFGRCRRRRARSRQLLSCGNRSIVRLRSSQFANFGVQEVNMSRFNSFHLVDQGR